MPRNPPKLTHALAGLLVWACAPDYELLNAGLHGESNDGGTSGNTASGGASLSGAGGQHEPDAGLGGSGAGTGGGKEPPGAGGVAGTTLGGTGGAPLGGAAGVAGGSAGVSGQGGTAGVSGGSVGVGGNGGSAGKSGSGGSAGKSGSGGSAGKSGSGGGGGSGGAIQEAPCAIAGQAFRFDSAGYVSAPRVIQDDFTVEAWVKTSASRSGDYFWEGDPIAWADSTVAGSHDFGMSVLNTRIFVNTGEPDVATFSTNPISTGAWVHMAVTRRQSTGVVQIFINGKLEATNIGTTATLDTVPVLSLGSTPKADYFLNGLMDEVRLWQVVRSATDINAAMHHVLRGDEAGLIAYYRFDSLTGSNGSTVPDLSGHANDAVAVGSNYSGALVVSNAPVCDPVPSGGTGGASGSGNGGTSGSGGTAGNPALGGGNSAGDTSSNGGSSGGGDSAGSDG